jgi:hypothetical protein
MRVRVNAEMPLLQFTPLPLTPTPGEGPSSGGTPLPGLEEDAFDLFERHCEADWFADTLPIPCQGVEGELETAAVFQRGQILSETGQVVSKALVVQLPENAADTTISAIYPVVQIQPGDVLTFSAGCVQGAVNCSVLFGVSYLDQAGIQHFLWTIGEFHDGQSLTHRVDLSHLSGMSIRLILEASSLGSSGDDVAFWVAPRIVRLPQPTPTGIPTQSAASTPVATATASAVPPTPLPTLTPPSLPQENLLESLVEALLRFLRSLWGG